MIAIKKCDSYTWRPSRGFQPRRAKTSGGSSDGGGGASEPARDTLVAQPPTTPAASRNRCRTDSAARVQALSAAHADSFNLEDKNIFCSQTFVCSQTLDTFT